MAQAEHSSFEKRLDSIRQRIADMRQHLDQHGSVQAGVKDQLHEFHKRCEDLKSAGQANDIGAKSLENGLESWISEIDKEYGSPPKRTQSVSM